MLHLQRLQPRKAEEFEFCFFMQNILLVPTMQMSHLPVVPNKGKVFSLFNCIVLGATALYHWCGSAKFKFKTDYIWQTLFQRGNRYNEKRRSPRIEPSGTPQERWEVPCHYIKGPVCQIGTKPHQPCSMNANIFFQTRNKNSVVEGNFNAAARLIGYWHQKQPICRTAGWCYKVNIERTILQLKGWSMLSKLVSFVKYTSFFYNKYT